MRLALQICAGFLLCCIPLMGMAQKHETRAAHSITTVDVPPENRVDINHSSIEELMKIPGLTRSWAGRIVRFRPYHAKNDLLERGVLSSQVYDRIKNYVIAHRDQQ